MNLLIIVLCWYPFFSLGIRHLNIFTWVVNLMFVCSFRNNGYHIITYIYSHLLREKHRAHRPLTPSYNDIFSSLLYPGNAFMNTKFERLHGRDCKNIHSIHLTSSQSPHKRIFLTWKKKKSFQTSRKLNSLFGNLRLETYLQSVTKIRFCN